MCFEGGRGRIVTGLLLGCFAVSILGIVQRCGGLGWGDPRWIGSTWFNRTFFAAYLLLLLPVAGWAAFHGANRLKWLGAVCLIAGLPSLFYTGARISWTALAPMACVAVFLAWTIASPGGRRRIIATVGLLTMGAAVSQVVLMYARPSRAPIAVVVRALGPSAPGNEQRLSLITAAVRVGLDRPLLGGGAGTFPIYAPERVPREYYNGVLDEESVRANVVIADAHNEPAQVFADTGLVGLALFISIPLSAFVLARRVVLANSAQCADKWLVIALLVGVTGFLSANLVGISARVPGEAAFYYLVLALVASVGQGAHPQGHVFRLFVRPLLVVVICLLLVSAWGVASDLRASIYLVRGESVLLDAQDVAGAEAAIQEFRSAARITPRSPVAQYELANALAVSGRHEEALVAYELVEELSPNYGRIHFNQGTSLYHLGRYSEAEREMALAYSLDHLPDSRERLDHLRELLRRGKTRL